MVISSRWFFAMCILVTLLLSAELRKNHTLAQGRPNPIARAASDEFQISARMDAVDAIHVVRKNTGEQYTIPSTSDVHHIEKLDVATNNRALAQAAHNVFGRSSMMLVLDLGRGTVADQLLGLRFSLSPDQRYIAFEEWGPAHFDNGHSSLGYVYDLAASSFENRITNAAAGIPVYPLNMLSSDVPASQRHEFGGWFSWLAGTDMFAFEDLFQGKTSIVIVDLRPGIRNRLTFVRTIDPPLLAQSPCANSPGFHIRPTIKPSSKGPQHVNVDLVAGTDKCGQFDIELPGLQMPQ